VKKQVAIIFGGRSGEHEVSLQSAESIRNALDKELFEPVLIGIDKKGVWRLQDPARSLLESPDGSVPRVREETTGLMAVGERGRALLREKNTGDVIREIDVFFPIAHGTFGEDGCLQGMLELLDAPYVGAGVLGSAAGMDKDVMKRLLRDAGLPGPRFVIVHAHEKDQISFDVLAKQLGVPFFIKPCNLGSSVGIAKIKSARSFDKALREAFRYDTKVIIEEGVVGRELECAVLGNAHPEASVVGEIVVNADFYSYEAKYLDENGAILKIPAPIDEETAKRVRQMAVRVFETLECAGMGRVDFFLKENGEILVNEINTLPGFTRVSMYPKLWEATGLPYPKLVTRLIELAEERHAQRSALKRDFK
jgi:D-alanine-D-alanine ligase